MALQADDALCAKWVEKIGRENVKRIRIGDHQVGFYQPMANFENLKPEGQPKLHHPKQVLALKVQIIKVLHKYKPRYRLGFADYPLVNGVE